MSSSSGQAPKDPYSEMREKIKRVAARAIQIAASKKLPKAKQAKPQKPKD